jgi:hypothetical protein
MRARCYVIDLRHFLSPAGAIAADLPGRARILAEYFASIVADATTNLDDPPRVRCRRRPCRRRCSGAVISFPTLENGEPIHWYCPVCHDQGWIHGWQNTFWDGFALEHEPH